MTDLTLLEIIDKIIAFLESLKKIILQTEDNEIIETPALTGIENLIVHVDKENGEEKEKEKSKQEIESEKNHSLLGLKISKLAVNALKANSKEIKSLSPKDQIEYINSQVKFYDDQFITDMRKIISLSDKHHEGLKQAANRAQLTTL